VFSRTLADNRDRALLRPIPTTTGDRQRSRGRSRGSSQGSQHQDFEGIGGLPALQQLHRLSVWVQSSSLRQKRWQRAIGILLGTDNVTRWSSWHVLIGKALRKRPQITEFLIDNEADLGGIDLSGPDWYTLQKAHTFLQPFAGATLYAEADKASISQTLELMDALLRHYEQHKARRSLDEVSLLTNT
jgi:hypothetical protein